MAIKEALLGRLIQTDGALSGNALAHDLGLDTDTVQSIIEQLRHEGHCIETMPGHVYRLLPDPGVLTETEIGRWRTAGPIGAQLEIYDELSSTNDRARELALAGAPHGTAVLARQQSSGRGRLGRAFFSPKGSGIYVSIVLRPEMAVERAVLLTPMCAIAVARATEQVTDGKVRADIKWVNDVCMNGRKICGILCEAGLDSGSDKLRFVIAGIGVNVGPMDFPEELCDIATSISNECGTPVGCSRFCALLLNELNALWPRLLSGDFMGEYRDRSNVIGREVIVMRGEERYPAYAVNIDDEGSLLVRSNDGQIRRLRSGEISIKFKP